MIVLPSDHYIENEKIYVDTLNAAVETAEKKRGLVTIGINPVRPETGYGYIEMGEPLNAVLPTYKVSRFTEKPNLEVAKDFILKGTYLWNSGMFVWRADTFLREMEKYLPKLYKIMMSIYQSLDTETEKQVIEEEYKLIDGISVDFGIMQKTRKAYVIKSELKWDDIGTFDALARFLGRYRGNNVSGTAFMDSSENCCVFGEGGRLIIGFGIKDLIVVDTKDVLLIMDKNKDQELKHLVNMLKDEEDMKPYL